MDALEKILALKSEQEAIVEKAREQIEKYDFVLSKILGSDSGDQEPRFNILDSKISPTVNIVERQQQRIRRLPIDLIENASLLFNEANKVLTPKDFGSLYSLNFGEHGLGKDLNYLRRLTNNNILRAIRIDENNKNIYFGLVEWFENGYFKKEYIPNDFDFEGKKVEFIAFFDRTS